MANRKLMFRIKYFITVLFLCTATARAAEPLRYEEERLKMGTTVRVTLYAESPETARTAMEVGFRRFDEIEAAMSDYDSGSEIVRLAIAADSDGEPTWRPVSDDLFTVLVAAKEMSVLSDGAFDVTAAPLTKLWRRARRLHTLPEPAKIEKAKRLVGFEAIESDAGSGDGGRLVRFTRPGLRIDLGGIAKGYAIDTAFEAIRKQSIDRVLIDAGGDMRFGNGPPDADNVPDNATKRDIGWNIGLLPAGKEGKPAIHRRMQNRAIAVSGDTFRFVEIDGVRYSHLVDPKTGIGLTTRLVVTVIADTAMQADALASAVSVLGVEKGIALIHSLPDVELMILEPGKTPEILPRLYSVETFAP